LSFLPFVDEYLVYILENKVEVQRSRDEYLLELMMIGTFWQNYFYKAQKSKHLSKVVLKRLYNLRKKNETFKPVIDKIRGYLAYELLDHHKNDLKEELTVASFLNLLEWMSATGEFNEEVLRLGNWGGFFASVNERDLEGSLRSLISFSSVFHLKGKEILGKYIPKVEDFLTNSLQAYKFREDYCFTARKENEYLLNMFGAEVMNRQLRSDFEKTSKKAVLMPTCMRTQPPGGCKARSDGKELVCVRCNKDCNIGKIAARVAKYEVTPYLIPHSSEFSRFLIKWKDEKGTGLIGVACVLNLLTGGYEMKRLGISSQCIFLDYCGCKKHWDKEGFVTNMNGNRLEEILT